jgi:hypothetical protein
MRAAIEARHRSASALSQAPTDAFQYGVSPVQSTHAPSDWLK